MKKLLVAIIMAMVSSSVVWAVENDVIAVGPDGTAVTTKDAVELLQKLHTMQTMIMGEDANKDGIRDDINTLIDEKYSTTPSEREVALKYARAEQAILEVGADVIAINRERAKMKACIHAMYVEQGYEGDELMLKESMPLDIESETVEYKTQESAMRVERNLKVIGKLVEADEITYKYEGDDPCGKNEKK